MSGALTRIIRAEDAEERNRDLAVVARTASLEELRAECRSLDDFRHRTPSLYERVRALFFLHAIYRLHLPLKPGVRECGHIPERGVRLLRNRRFEEAATVFREFEEREGTSQSIASALAAAYHGLGFQTLADQVRRSVRAVRGNRWMFRVGHPDDHPLRICAELLPDATGAAAVLAEHTPVRMDLTHSAWSDIFFLGMDFPEGAKVLNVSIDLALRGRDREPAPPIETRLRVIDRPVLVLESIDLGARAEIEELADVFDFAKDYLGLLKAAVIAAGVVPPGLEGSRTKLSALLERMAGPGRGLELTSCVRGIPKGSRLAVSTNLLASLIALCARATGQTERLTGPLTESERRLAAARAILGEWLGGSGGGWQDSGGLWPGIKLIQGETASEGDPEFGISRGRLLPSHTLLGDEEVSPDARRALQDSLVLVHGGMAQDVGPILEMVTEKYLLRSTAEWTARKETLEVLREVRDALGRGDMRALGAATTRNFTGPLQTIIPWASNLFTERMIARAQAEFGDDYWGFWMLGGMSGGGMGLLFAPERRAEAQDWLAEDLTALKRELEHALPFAMEPVVYDFRVNESGSTATLEPAHAPRLELPRSRAPVQRGAIRALSDLLDENGFDRTQHETVRAQLLAGEIGLAQNRLAARTSILEVEPGDVEDAGEDPGGHFEMRGADALSTGQVAVVTLAAGSGSRWTRGAGVVKALNPFARFAGVQRSFLEVHQAKSRRTRRVFGSALPHVFTTSYLTHDPIARVLEGAVDAPLLSRGRAVGLRLVPSARDLRFAWHELQSQRLDAQAQKVRESLEDALIGWARSSGEGSDYTDNEAHLCMHPVGHWYEVPGLFLNGTLARLCDEQPELTTLLLHNVDTLGADVDPTLLGRHLASEATLTFEVLPRCIDDTGGGLARVDGRLQLVEGLALPREEDEWNMSLYNSMTTWIDIDGLLRAFGLTRTDLQDNARVHEAVRALAARMPTYVTLKDVKKRWGLGQEDVYPVAQFEKLWSDMSALPGLDCRYVAVPRMRGGQLKDPAQLDGWLQDGSAAFVAERCDW